MASLITLLITIISSRASELRLALRKTIEDDVQGLSDSLYEVVAASVHLAKAKSDEQFKKWRSCAVEATKEVDDLRRRLRYPLWGLDEGFGTIRRLPLFIAHSRQEPKRQDAFIQLATKLRIAIDRAVIRAYTQGRRPSIIDRLRVHYRARALNNLFDSWKSPIKHEEYTEVNSD